MNAETLIDEIEGMFKVNVKYAERIGLDHIPFFTVARAKTILNQIKDYKDKNKKVLKNYSYQSKLDKLFETSM
jgi:hypothetical protein